MSLRQLWKQSCLASAPQNFPLDLLEQQFVVERSLFEPAEHPKVRRETGSESWRRLPELECWVGQPGSRLVKAPR